ncbi:uncharacterized protein BO97DRAFT_404862 [Aspergillus homomorphus CBS 101889]|uniref:Cytochrome c oxidase assembly factor 3 n=1 Tax=Aspergillus homomorphus (strain CBS 101889) TaxID=1450537 RepID=A0A395I146_ASPHC|nr:hypothetical protein BO97DRAFT_404862 [Aspergillus homomorphus CBS 101889]RAL13333.1 hypothetical protein BO97DRAFT_404862 [Aspergillus homomorphus CBS 101889]
MPMNRAQVPDPLAVMKRNLKYSVASIVGVVGGTYFTFRYFQWAKGNAAEESYKYGRSAVVSENDVECMKGSEGKHSARAPHDALTSPWPSRD